MIRCLVDAGPLIALFDSSDKYHKSILDFLKKYNGVLVTSWPVVTEILHMLDFSVRSQIDFLRWVERGGLEVAEITVDDLARIISLSEKYSDIPMDFADASLLIISETEGISEIITIDSDFYLYRNIRNKSLKNIFAP